MESKKQKRKVVQEKYVKELTKLMKNPSMNAKREDMNQYTEAELVHKSADHILLRALDDLGLKELVVAYMKLDCNYLFDFGSKQN